MTDLEQQLSRLLHERASSIEVRPDLQAVVASVEVDADLEEDVSLGRGRYDRAKRSRRFVFVACTVAATVLLLLTALAVRVRPSAAPRPIPGALPTAANGVILFSDASQLTQVDPSGAGRSVLLPRDSGDGKSSLSWAPDGDRFVYVHGADIVIFDVRSGATTRIATCSAGCTVAWSPDGTAIAAAGFSTAITVFDADGPADQTGHTLAVAGGVPSDPTWSPDSQRIIFRFHSNDGGYGIESVSRDGRARSTLAAANPTGSWVDYFSVALSPDGSTLAWLGGHPTEQEGATALELMTMSVDGGPVRSVRDLAVCFCLGFSPGLAWSPNGEQFAVVIPPVTPVSSGVIPTAGGDGFVLYTVNADGSNLTSLGRLAWGTPFWQPVPTTDPRPR